MNRYEDIDGIDAPFERAMEAAMKDDERAAAEREHDTLAELSAEVRRLRRALEAIADKCSPLARAYDARGERGPAYDLDVIHALAIHGLREDEDPVPLDAEVKHRRAALDAIADRAGALGDEYDERGRAGQARELYGISTMADAAFRGARLAPDEEPHG